MPNTGKGQTELFKEVIYEELCTGWGPSINDRPYLVVYGGRSVILDECTATTLLIDDRETDRIGLVNRVVPLKNSRKRSLLWLPAWGTVQAKRMP